jgi:hypothetical protein
MGEEAAHQHGWCGAYDAILNELGISRPVRRVTGTITLTLGFTGTPALHRRPGRRPPLGDLLRPGHPPTG